MQFVLISPVAFSFVKWSVGEAQKAILKQKTGEKDATSIEDQIALYHSQLVERDAERPV